MAQYRVPDLTDDSLVCSGPCSHDDCPQVKAEWADRRCFECAEPLKAGDLIEFYEGTERVRPHRRAVAHYRCSVAAAEAQKAGAL